MSSPFVDREWLDAIARVVAGSDAMSTAQALSDAVSHAVDHEGTCLLAFHRSEPPEVLHHTLEPAGARHYVDRYLAGPYLLDPLYELALRQDRPGVCRFREEAPDRFRSSEYYRQYCERTHLKDEMDFLVEVDADTTLALVVGRRRRRFSKSEVDRLRLIDAVVHESMRKIWRLLGRTGIATERAAVHERFTRCFENFGDGVLTDREQETTRLLLRGFSTKAIARRLGIAPGTVMVHKRNLFRKLGITSQYELFSMFIDRLSGA